MENPPQSDEDIDSLESPETQSDSASPAGASQSATTSAAAGSDGSATPATGPGKKQKLGERFQGIVTHLNIYLLIFILMVVVAAGFVFVSLQRNKKELATPELTIQELTQEDLEKINETEAKVGDPKQTLTIESNSIFSGAVLVRGSLDVAGAIKVGGALNLPGITVSGTSSFDQIAANKAVIAGDATVQGTLSVQKNLTLAGGATFGGPISAPQITAQSIHLTSDLNITRHIDAGGPTPGKTDGTALGAGGTSSVGGTDTAGTVTINTGGSPSVGCFVTINFANKFNSTPHVVITPVGSAAAALNYYINRNTTSFSICTTNAAPPGQNFAFDYIVID